MTDKERKLSKKARAILYTMIAIQLIAWAWFSSQGGQLPDKAFLIFTFGMIIGQFGAGIETLVLRAWGTLAIQIWFFFFTTWGGIVRFMQM